MKVLMFSSDPEILKWQSPAMQRMLEYGELFDEIFIYLLIREPAGSVNISDRVKVRVFSGRISRFFRGAIAVYKLLKSEEIAVVTMQEIEHAVIGYALCRPLKVKWQMQIHTDVFSPYFKNSSFVNWLRSYFAEFLIPRASCIRVVSERIKRSIQKRFSDRKLDITTLPIYVDADRLVKLLPSFDVHDKYKEFKFIILMVSRLTCEKNIGLAIQAMSEVVKKEPNAGLVVVGEGPESNKLKVRSEKLKVSNNVKFEGWVDDLVSYYKTADLYLLTSDYEGYGRTVVEALACNLPVLMTDVGVSGESVFDGVNGIIFPVSEFLGLASGIIDLIQSKKAYEELKKNAKLPTPMPSKEEYLERYKKSFEDCGA